MRCLATDMIYSIYSYYVEVTCPKVTIESELSVFNELEELAEKNNAPCLYSQIIKLNINYNDLISQS